MTPTKLCRPGVGGSIWRKALLMIAGLSCGISTVSQAAAPYYLSWEQLYEDTAPQAQVPHAIAMDSRGNVFVTGQEDSGDGQGFYTAKYDALDGHLLWQKRVTPIGTNQFIAYAIAVDSQGNCVVTGSRNVAGQIDYYTIKYHGDDGTIFWANPVTYNGTADGEDTALKVVCLSNNDVVVTGRSRGNNGNPTGFDITTIRYAAATGAQVGGIDRYTTAASFDDVPADMAVDSLDNVIIVGTSKPGNLTNFYIRKLTSALLIDWSATAFTSDEGGATAVAIDSDDAVIAAGMYNDGSDLFGYYVFKFDKDGVKQWETTTPLKSAMPNGSAPSQFGPDKRPQPTGIAIGPDKGPIITGFLLNSSNEFEITTIKYQSSGLLGGTVANPAWPQPARDPAIGFGDGFGRAIVCDSAGNAIVVGESENEAFDTDLYFAKYDGQTGNRVYAASRPGSQGTSDFGVGIATDKFGNIAALGELRANKGGTGIGRREFATLKLNRFIAPTGEELPDNIEGVDEAAKITVATPPAISFSGTLAARVTFKAGRAIGRAILVEGSAAGGTLLPAVKGQPAPVAVGESPVNWVSFSDPVIAPNGTYAFAGKVSGSPSKSNGVWTNMSGTLKLALRQGTEVPGTGEKLVKVLSLSMENDALVALVKLSGLASKNSALVRLNAANEVTVLLRTGSAGYTINSNDHTIKKITVLSPVPKQAGDGRWQGIVGIVARVDTFQTNTPSVKASAIVTVSHAAVKSELLFTGQDAPVPNNPKYTGFGLPSTGLGTLYFATKANLAGPAASNSALIYKFFSVTAPTSFGQKGAMTNVTGLPATATYTAFTDPIINSAGNVAFIGTIKGSPAEVKSSSNRAIIFGSPTSTLSKVARTGDFSTDSAGNPERDAEGNLTNAKWTSFTTLALPSGTGAGPIFLAKTSAKRNNIGLWARATDGKIRRLIGVGDDLDGLIVKKMTLLNPAIGAPAAARSFDDAGSVAVFLNFKNGESAILRIGIP